jgi:hypothetical protein
VIQRDRGQRISLLEEEARDQQILSKEGWGQALNPAESLTVSAHEMYAEFWMMQTNGFTARDFRAAAMNATRTASGGPVPEKADITGLRNAASSGAAGLPSSASLKRLNVSPARSEAVLGCRAALCLPDYRVLYTSS